MGWQSCHVHSHPLPIHNCQLNWFYWKFIFLISVSPCIHSSLTLSIKFFRPHMTGWIEIGKMNFPKDPNRASISRSLSVHLADSVPMIFWEMDVQDTVDNFPVHFILFLLLNFYHLFCYFVWYFFKNKLIL